MACLEDGKQFQFPSGSAKTDEEIKKQFFLVVCILGTFGLLSLEVSQICSLAHHHDSSSMA